MGFPGLRTASSGLLQAIKAGARFGRRNKQIGQSKNANRFLSAAPIETDATPAIASISRLQSIVKTYLPAKDIARIKEAYRFSDESHLGQFRSSGSPYITHPIAVAEICAGWKLDADALMAALLHDVMEDQDVPKTTLAKQFGGDVAELVDGLSKLDRLDFISKAEHQAEIGRAHV